MTAPTLTNLVTDNFPPSYRLRVVSSVPRLLLTSWLLSKEKKKTKSQFEQDKVKHTVVLIRGQVSSLTNLVERMLVLNRLKSQWYGETHISRGTECDRTPALTIEWTPVCSLLFYPGFYHSPSLPLPSARFFFFCIAELPHLLQLQSGSLPSWRHSTLVFVRKNNRNNSLVAVWMAKWIWWWMWFTRTAVALFCAHLKWLRGLTFLTKKYAVFRINLLNAPISLVIYLKLLWYIFC